MSIATLMGASKMGLNGEYIAAVVILGIFLLEPFLVATTGGTIGHHLRGIKVVNSKTMSAPGIVRATLRFIAKTLFGLFSLVAVVTSRKHQAVHDYLSGSMVVIKNPGTLPAHEKLKEREVEDRGYSYPSKVRRVVIIILYNVIFLAANVFLLVFLMSENCLSNSACSTYDQALSIASQMLWVVGTITLLVFGWRGQLWGCRRKQHGAAGT